MPGLIMVLAPFTSSLVTIDGACTRHLYLSRHTYTSRDDHSAEPSYAVTAHAAEGATTSVCLALVTGAKNRQWLARS